MVSERWLGAISGVPDPIWECIQGIWSRGLVPSAGNALLAAAALSTTEKMSEAHLTWLIEESKAQLCSGRYHQKAALETEHSDT